MHPQGKDTDCYFRPEGNVMPPKLRTQKELDVMLEIYQQFVDGLITAEECLDHPGFKIPALLELVNATLSRLNGEGK